MNALSKVYKSMSDKKEQLRKLRATLKANEAKLSALFSDLEAIGSEPWTDGDWIFVSLTGDKVKFLQFARVIRKHGFALPTIEKGATGFTKLEWLGDDGQEKVPLHFQFSSTACRRVKVGTKMVEQDVFETVCDELMPYEPAQPAPAAIHDDLPF